MTRRLPKTIFIVLIIILQGCASPKHIYHKPSYERQKELKNSRGANVFIDIMAGIGSVCVGAMLDTEVDYVPTDQQFKKLKLINPTTDTMYINMLTDLVWDNEDYCDFMDIRIPPKQKCKVMVPMHAAYHLYFSNTPQSDDDEMIEIFTTDVKRFSLYPGITLDGDSTALQKE